MRLTVLAGAVLLHTGCKRESPAEAAAAQMEPLRPAAMARIAALEKLAPVMKASPSLTADAVSVAAGAIKFGEATTYEPTTAGLIYEANLDDVRAPHNKDPQPMPKAGLFGVCGALLNGGGFVADHSKARVLENCGNARYALMVRTLKREKPQVDEQTRTFVPGVHEGEVHVYDLEGGQNLGGFRFAEKNADTVTTRGISNPTEIDSELSMRVQHAIQEGLSKYATK